MVATTFNIQFKKIAGALGIVEGAAWAMMALSCLILYNHEPISLQKNSHMDIVNFEIYYRFLVKGSTEIWKEMGQTLTPDVFTGFAWVYFFLHLLWIGLSVNVGMSKEQKLPLAQKAWGYLTLLISLWDLITSIILGLDYRNCVTNPILDEICANAILPVLTIVAKGFVLWLINIILAVILLRTSNRIKQNPPPKVTTPYDYEREENTGFPRHQDNLDLGFELPTQFGYERQASSGLPGQRGYPSHYEDRLRDPRSLQPGRLPDPRSPEPDRHSRTPIRFPIDDAFMYNSEIPEPGYFSSRQQNLHPGHRPTGQHARRY